MAIAEGVSGDPAEGSCALRSSAETSPFPVLCRIEAQTSLEAKQQQGQAPSSTCPWQQVPVVLSSLELSPTSRSLRAVDYALATGTLQNASPETAAPAPLHSKIGRASANEKGQMVSANTA